MTVLELARRQRQMSQVELAAATRIGTHFLSLLEQSRAVPTDAQRQRIAAALGITPESLLLPVADVTQTDAAVASRGRLSEPILD